MHNEERRKREQHIRRLHRILKNNWTILTKLNKGKTTRLLRSRLEAADFHFGYHTSLLTTPGQQTYYYCYDQGHTELNDSEVLLVRRTKNDNN